MLSLDDDPQGRALKMFSREVMAMQSLNHKHIIKLHSWNESDVHVDEFEKAHPVAYIGQEAALGGELGDYIRYSGAFDEATCRYVFHQLLQGVHHIHSKGYAHRDLKPDNLIFDDKFDLKIADFGLAASLHGDGDGLYRECVGTPAYMAPEIIHGHPW